MKRHNNNNNVKLFQFHRWTLSTTLLFALLITLSTWRLLSHPQTGSPQQPGSSPSDLPTLPKLAYLISGSNGDGSRIQRLLRATHHPRNYYIVLMDAEASDEERLGVAKMGLKNVMVLGRPNIVTSHGPTELANTLHGAAILLKKSQDWDWFVNLRANDYPLISQNDLLHVLSYLPRDLNFFEHTSNLGGKEDEIGKPIIIDSGLYHTKKSAIFWAKQRRSMPASFKLFMGSSGMMLSKALVEMCVIGWDNLPRTLLLYHTNTLRSSESYFHTVACNHKEYQNTTVNHDLRFTVDSTVADTKLTLSLPEILKTGVPFAQNIQNRPQMLDAIDAHLIRRRSRNDRGFDGDGENDDDDDDVVVPSLDSVRFQNLILKLLHPRNFRPNQCN